MEHIGRYQIIGELGKGAMGVVYKATDPNIGRTVALKTLRLDLHGMEADEMLQRFKNESRAAGVMSHPNIITIFDAGEQDGMFYIAMEFIEGRTLQQLLKEGKVLPLEQVVDIVRQVCAGLDYAHAHGIVHRDIKPANIMITDTTVKIMDFGIAKGGGSGMTSTGQVVGTPNYMSPEQVKGKDLDGRTDLFSLGVMLYEMVTGERPFSGQNITTIIYKIVNEMPPAPHDLDGSVHPGLSAVIMKALSKDPEQRYVTGADFARDLENYRSLPADTRTVRAATPLARPPASAPGNHAPIALSARSVAWTAAATKSSRQQSVALESTVTAEAPTVFRSRPPRRRKFVPVIAIVATIAVVTSLIGAYLRSHRGMPAAPATVAQVPTPEPPPRQRKATPGTPNRVPAAVPAKAEVGDPAPVIELGALQISSAPFGARVTIDGKTDPDWQTPFAAARLKPGTHSVKFALKGYQPETRQVEVVAGQKLPLIVPMQVAYGAVALDSNPAGAAIYVDGSDSGQVTPARLTLNEGKHRIALRKQGFKPQITFADVAGGKTVNLAPALVAVGAAEPTPAVAAAQSQGGGSPFRRLRRLFGKSSAEGDGVLAVRTRPKGAQIWLGEWQASSRTPASLPVAPGTYKLTLRLPGYKPITRSVQIEQGKTMGVEETLEPQ